MNPPKTESSDYWKWLPAAFALAGVIVFISGSTQLAVSGLYFGVLIFGFAMLTAGLLYGKEE